MSYSDELEMLEDALARAEARGDRDAVTRLTEMLRRVQVEH